MLLYASIWTAYVVILPIAAAALVDVAFFVGDLKALGWLNYPFVWLAVHQLGYAWHERRLAGTRVGAPMLIGGLLALVALTHLGPYPLSLVGVPSDEISNTLPPKLPLLALAAAQIGLVLMLEAPARRWLENRVPWAATILINGMIMTIFLWHSTVMMLLVGLAFWQMPGVLAQQPDTAGWWWTRPLWLLVYALVTVPFLLAFGRFERPSTGRASRPAALALDGVGGEGWLGLRWIPLLTPLVGAGLAGFGPLGFAGRSLTGGRSEL